MTLEELYYISQIVTVIAIFASLIFVGVQIRQNSAQMRAQTQEAIHGGVEPAMMGKSFKVYWQSRKAGFSPAFAAFFDKEMERYQPIAFPQTFYAAGEAPAQPPLSETQSTQP